MTYFETPFDRQAHMMGVTTEELQRALDAAERDLAYLDALDRPDVDVEYRDRVSASDIHPSQWED